MGGEGEGVGKIGHYDYSGLRWVPLLVGSGLTYNNVIPLGLLRRVILHTFGKCDVINMTSSDPGTVNECTTSGRQLSRTTLGSVTRNICKLLFKPVFGPRSVTVGTRRCIRAAAAHAFLGFVLTPAAKQQATGSP